MKINPKIYQTLKSTILSVGTLLLLTTSANAIESNNLQITDNDEASTNTFTSNVKPISSPVLVAELYNYCNSGESLFLAAETDGFFVNICGGNYPHTYIGVDKYTGNSIRLPLSDYAYDGTWYEAQNGNYYYSIIFNTTRGHFLNVTENGRNILQEHLIDWSWY